MQRKHWICQRETRLIPSRLISATKHLPSTILTGITGRLSLSGSDVAYCASVSSVVISHANEA